MASHSHSHQNAVIRTYLGLLLLTVCVFALMYCPQPMLYTLSQEFGVSKSNSALLVSVFMFFLVISPMCVGILLDRIGVRKALLVSTFLVGISGAGIYFAPNFLVLVGVLRLCLFLCLSRPSWCPSRVCSGIWTSTGPWPATCPVRS